MVCCIALAMLIPLFTELLFVKNSNFGDFILSLLVTCLIGFCLVITNRKQEKIILGMREAFLTTTLSWIMCSIFASLPFHWGNPCLSWIDSLFESISAITTTGSTVINNLNNTHKGILLWRSILQWLGGIGIVVMGMIVFPILQIGGMQLFRSEFSDRSEKILPKASQIATAIFITYGAFTILCTICLYLSGMGFFDAVCHAATTISTGGLSTKDAGIMHFNNPIIEMIIVFFMTIGGSTLILYVRMWRGEYNALIKDHQTIVYLLIMFSFTVIMILYLCRQGFPFSTGLRHGLFNVVSIMTTTGFASADYVQWGSFPLLIIFFISFLGGCTGSTTGGIKVFRLQIVLSFIKCHLKQLRKPHGVFLPFYNGQKITDNVAVSVFCFISIYFLTILILSLFLALSGLDFISSLSGAVASLSNTGPALGNVIGPTNCFNTISNGTKITMMVGMILGRLELLTVMILFIRAFWKD